MRHGEIFRSDGLGLCGSGARSGRLHAPAHRLDEFPAGYSWAGCAPAEPASASPTGSYYEAKGRRWPAKTSERSTVSKLFVSPQGASPEGTERGLKDRPPAQHNSGPPWFDPLARPSSEASPMSRESGLAAFPGDFNVLNADGIYDRDRIRRPGRKRRPSGHCCGRPARHGTRLRPTSRSARSLWRSSCLRCNPPLSHQMDSNIGRRC